MKHTRVQTPTGTRDFLPSDCARRRKLEGILSDTFTLWGYEEVDTPTLEYQDVVLLGQGGIPDEAMYKLFDREGNTLVLRPDMTMPIGRLTATRLKQSDLPHRLFYIANVFRHTGVETGRQREFHQAGIELIGASGSAADAEVIAVANDVFTRAGLGEVFFDIGHVGFVRGLMDTAKLSISDRMALSEALVEKDYVRMTEVVGCLLSQVSAEGDNSAVMRSRALNALLRIPELRGEIGVMDVALLLTQGIDESVTALAEMRETITHLSDYGLDSKVAIDLGMVKDFDYYTGVTLEGYAKGFGAALCSGGRYDSLLGHFGFSCPATGFAIGIEWLMTALALDRQASSGRDGGMDDRCRSCYVVAALPFDDSRKAGLDAVKRMRFRGVRVAVELLDRPPDEIERHARTGGASLVLWSLATSSNWEVTDLDSGRRYVIDQEELIHLLTDDRNGNPNSSRGGRR